MKTITLLISFAVQFHLLVAVLERSEKLPTDLSNKTIENPRKMFTRRYCFVRNKVEIPDVNELRKQLSGKVLKVTALEEYPFTYTILENGVRVGKGASFKLFNVLAKKYNFSYEILLPRNNVYGNIRNKNGSLLELVTNGQADMAIGFIPPMKDFRTRILYSKIVNLAKYHIMMVKPGGSRISKSIFQPFTNSVWACTITAFLFMGPVIYVVVVIQNQFLEEERVKHFSQIIWFIYGAFVRQGHSCKISPIYDSTRLLFATWWIFVTILASFYTANLVAFLARAEFPLNLNSIEDFIQTNAKLYVKKGGSVEYSLLTDERLAPLKDKISKATLEFAQGKDETRVLLESMIDDNLAIIADYYVAQHMMYDYYLEKRKYATGFDEREQCPFILSKKPLFWKTLAFAYDCRTQLNFLFDLDLQNLLETGITKHLTLMKLPDTDVCALSKQKAEIQLKVRDLEWAFYTTVTGYLVSTLIFFGEMYFRRYKRTKSTAGSRNSTVSNNSVLSAVIQDLMNERAQVSHPVSSKGKRELFKLNHLRRNTVE